MSKCCCCTDGPSIADDPRVIFSIYFIAFIPLAFIYALDFITDKWRSIRDTRRNGMIQLFVSLTSLGCIIYYIDLQIKNRDYKEAATAIAVAVLNSYHVLRTIWGLILLLEFRNWNISALRFLIRQGYRAPRYEYSDGVKNMLLEMKAYRPLLRLFGKLKTSFSFACRWLLSWRQCASPSSVSTEPNSSSSARTDQITHENQTCSSRLSAALQFMKSNGPHFYNWVMGNMEKKYSSAESLKDIEKTVDYHMVVNSSLIDNEFSNSELPVRLVPSLRVRHSDLERHSYMARILASCLKSTKPEECSVRWLVSFLARFGYQWLADTRGLGLEDTESGTELQRAKRNTSQHLAVIVSAHTTQGSVEKTNGSTENFVTFFPPYHRYCTGYQRSSDAAFDVTERCVLPFKMNGSFDQTLYFRKFEATIRDAAKDDWHKKSLNELAEKQRTAVENVTPDQLVYFASLMEEDDWGFQNSSETVNWERINAGFDALMYQLGNNTGEDQEQFFRPLPVRKEVLSSLLWETSPNCLMIQTSIHVDNFLALEYGDRHGVHREEISGHSHVGEPELATSVLEKQYNLEMKRLRLNMLKPISQDVPRFIGSVTESVRSILASWVAANDAEAVGWYASTTPVGIRFLCSKQLCSAFSDMRGSNANNRSLCMRLVWEAQAHLQWRVREELRRKVEDIRQSPFLIMLFILGFPGLKMERTKHESAFSELRHGNLIIEFEDGIIVKPIAGPQELHILLTCDQESKTMSVIFCPECPIFNWQEWKDAVMGRLTAKKDWRLSRLFSRNELLRTEANHSDICSPVQYIAPETLGKDYGLKYWSGWPPFMPQITEFEIRSMVEEKYGLTRSELFEVFSIECIDELNAAMDIHFQVGTDASSLYLDGFRAMQEGRVDDALRLFGRCIGEHGHREALKDAYGLVIRRSPVCDAQLVALETAMDAQFKNLVNRSHIEELNRRVDEIDLEMLSDYFGRIFEQTSSEDALKKKALALFYKNGANRAVSEEAIQAIEAFIAYNGERILSSSFLIYNSPFLFYLAVAYQSLFHESKDPAKQKIAAKYLQRSGDCFHFGRGDCFALNVGYLLEKGYFVGRDAERKNAMLEILCEEVACGDEKMLRAMVDRLFVKPSASEEGKNEVEGHARVFGIGIHLNDAMALYDGLSCLRFPNCKNRLGLLYHKRAAIVSANASAAEEQYSYAIKKGSEDALCNMGVLKCGTTGHEAGISYMNKAVEGGSSTGMNNRAVAYELGRGINRNVVEAERLYKQAIEVDKNPIAIYNLAVLYMWGDPEVRNGEIISESQTATQSMISELSAPETGLERLYTLQDQVRKYFLFRNSETEPVLSRRVELEELDDCLAYVKILETDGADIGASDQEGVEACI